MKNKIIYSKTFESSGLIFYATVNLSGKHLFFVVDSEMQ